jgi:chemotaxis protein CheD
MELRVGMGQIKVAEAPHSLVAIGLGSCVAVVFYDRYTRIGGMAHIALPAIADSPDGNHPYRFADLAIPEILRQMESRGASIDTIEARLIGGANMFPDIINVASTMNVGARNVLAVKDQLANYGIPIVAEDTGRNVGRSVSLDTRDGWVVVRTMPPSERDA